MTKTMAIRMVEQALSLLTCDKAGGAHAGISLNQWELIAKQKAITTLELLKMQLEEDEEPECAIPEEQEQTRKPKHGRYMGFAGLAPDYEERTGTY